MFDWMFLCAITQFSPADYISVSSIRSSLSVQGLEHHPIVHFVVLNYTAITMLRPQGLIDECNTHFTDLLPSACQYDGNIKLFCIVRVSILPVNTRGLQGP